MKRLSGFAALVLSALLCVSLACCKGGQGKGGYPAVLHYAFAPESETLQTSGINAEGLRKYLQDQLHMPVQIVRVEGYAPTIEAMRSEKVDIANFGSLGYIVAAEKGGAEAIVSRGNPDGTLGGYRSVIAVPKGSSYNSLADLKAHSKDIVFAFADPASTSGNLFPRVGLLNAGINPEKDFKKVVFAGNHLASAMTVKAGKVDAGAFMEAVRTRLITANKMQPEDVRVIWTSDLIPNGPLAVRKALPEQLKKDIQAAMLAMPQRDPALWANISSTYRTISSATKYIAVNDATYDGLRKYTTQVKDFNFVEK
jgi:phosphonate transport system substrate-binding protein